MRLAKGEEMIDVWVDGKGYVFETKLDVLQTYRLEGHAGVKFAQSLGQALGKVARQFEERQGLVRGKSSI